MIGRRIQRKLLIYLILGAVAGELTVGIMAGTNDGSDYRVTHWTTDEGLPQNRISCLTQTRDGYLWIGTWFGLARFDGVRFTVFDKSNTPELLNDAVNALAEDTDGTLWVGTADGLLSYRDHHFHRFTATDGLPDKVWRLAASRFGGLWIQAGDSVARLGGEGFSGMRRMPVSFKDIRGLYERADGTLDVLTEFSWRTLSSKGDELLTNEIENVSGAFWLAGLPASQPRGIWLGTQSGLRRWTGQSWETIDHRFVGHLPVDFIYEDRSSNLWVNLRRGGLYHQLSTNWAAVNLEDRGVPASTICMEEDREGNLWMGTDQGLVQLQKRRVRAYTAREGLPSDNVWSVCEGSDGVIWVGTDRGLGRIQNGRVLPLNPSDSFWDEADRCVWPSRKGGVWIVKPGIAIFKYQDNPVPLVSAKSLPNPSVFALFEDRQGRLVIGTGDGIAILQNGQVTTSERDWAVDSGYDVRCILQDRAGAFWFGTQGQGLVRGSNGQFEVFTERDGISNNHVWSIYEDTDAALWLGTENGLTRYRNGRFFSFRRGQGLLENDVNWILEDDFGYLWLSGQRGIYRIKREQLNSVAEGRASAVQVAAFGTADGMESSETNGEGQPAGWKARDGQLWFPTTLGVVVIDPKNIDVNEVPPPVVIEQVKADDEVIFGDGEPRSNRISEIQAPDFSLPPGRAQAVEISYTANTLVNPKRARFRYRMVGRDSSWREETSDRVAHYTNLRPGNYRFEITAANHHGVWNPTPESFRFSVAPHFYETWLFYFLMGTGTLAAAMAIHFWRVRFLQRIERLEQQQAVHSERGRIARDLHDELGSRLTALAMRAELEGRNSNRADADNRRTVAEESRALAERMRDAIWAVDPECDSLEAFVAYLTEHADEFSGTTDIRLRLELPDELPALPLSAHARHQLAMFARESLHNVLKHARASEVKLRLELRDGALWLRVSDNGIGLGERRGSGRGLENMRSRVHALGGLFQIRSGPGEGTIVEARVPLKNLGRDSSSK